MKKLVEYSQQQLLDSGSVQQITDIPTGNSKSLNHPNEPSLTLTGAHAGCLLSQRIVSSAKHDHRQTAGSAAPHRTVTPYSVCTNAGIEMQLVSVEAGGHKKQNIVALQSRINPNSTGSKMNLSESLELLKNMTHKCKSVHLQILKAHPRWCS